MKAYFIIRAAPPLEPEKIDALMAPVDIVLVCPAPELGQRFDCVGGGSLRVLRLNADGRTGDVEVLAEPPASLAPSTRRWF
jgi:hypothetical protein